MAAAITTVTGWAETMLSTIVGNETLVVFFAIGVCGSVLGLVRNLVHTR